MRNLRNPKWIFLINTLPIVVMFILFLSEFNIIKSLLADENIVLWINFGWILGILAVSNIMYASYLIYKKQKVSFVYGIIALVSSIAFIYLFGFYSETIIPSTIPQWMLSGSMFIYVGTFLMPTLAYSLFILVTHFTPEAQEHKPWKNIIAAIFIPAVWYLFAQIILPLWQPVDDNFRTHVVLILIITGTIFFLFFLIRAIFILTTKKINAWRKYQLAWKIPIAIIFPLLGLAVNSGFLLGFEETDAGIFGNFSNLWFYILAAINGILICLPERENRNYRIFLFAGRSITFSFTLYFFIVFLPFLPISIIALLAFGTGFLMLTPLVLFILHTDELTKDFNYLKRYFSVNSLVIASFLCFLIFPVLITITYIQDKNTLNKTLQYIDSPDYSQNYRININSLKKTIDIVKRHKNVNGHVMFGHQIPYLSKYFNWLVLDNLTLSDGKISIIEKVFFGRTSIKQNPEDINNHQVKVTDIQTESKYDHSQKAWISQVNMEITNNNDSWFSEFSTVINLPHGCWISDYYLYVGNRKEKGILAERKTAMWVFSQIRNENKDPGLLYYLTGNKVAFRIFPFAKKEVRKTGIEFLHREPVEIMIDGNLISLGNESEVSNYGFENEHLIYVSAREKKNLNKVQRKPYFHFLVDVSSKSKKNISKFSRRIEQIMIKYPSLANNAKVSYINSYVTSGEMDNNWKKIYHEQNFEGGFYLDRAIRKTLVNAYQRNDNSYPVMIVVTDNIYEAIFNKDFSDLEITFPENDLFFHLNEENELIPHSLISNTDRQQDSTKFINFNHSVSKYTDNNNNVWYLPDNNKPSIILKKDVFNISEKEIKEKNWETAINLYGKWISQNLHPENSDREWLNLVKYSFDSKIMTPVTSYLVVENEAQKAMLKKKQKQVLAGNKSFDPGEDVQSMSEPGFILMVILLGIVIWMMERRKKINRRGATM